MMKITGLSHLFKLENLHNWWLTKYFFAPLYINISQYIYISIYIYTLKTGVWCSCVVVAPEGRSVRESNH